MNTKQTITLFNDGARALTLVWVPGLHSKEQSSHPALIEVIAGSSSWGK